MEEEEYVWGLPGQMVPLCTPGLLGPGGPRALAPPVFGRSVDPIQNRKADHTHQITSLPSGYSDPPTALTPQPLSPHWILPLELPHSLPPPSRPSPEEHMETAGNCPNLLLAETFSNKLWESDYAHTGFENVPPVLRPTRCHIAESRSLFCPKTYGLVY